MAHLWDRGVLNTSSWHGLEEERRRSRRRRTSASERANSTGSGALGAALFSQRLSQPPRPGPSTPVRGREARGAIHPAPTVSVASLKKAIGIAHGPRFTLDSTVREVMGALDEVEGLKVVPAEGTWTVGGSTLGRVRPGFEGFAKTIPAPWEASGLVMGQDAHGHKVVTRRLSALAPTHLEALVALANVVVGDGTEGR